MYRKFQKRCRWLAFAGLVFICIFSFYLMNQSVPDKIRIVAGREETFDLKVPVTGELNGSKAEVSVNQSPKVSSDRVHIDMNQTFTLKSSKEGKFSIVCKLFGIFSFKEVDVEVINEEMVVPCGIPIGIYVKTDGILAIGTGTVTGLDGMNYEPAYHLVKSGDYIKTVNGEAVTTKEELMEKVSQYGTSDVVLGLVREKNHGFGLARARTDDENIAFLHGRAGVVAHDIGSKANLRAVHRQHFNIVAGAAPARDENALCRHHGIGQRVNL